MVPPPDRHHQCRLVYWVGLLVHLSSGFHTPAGNRCAVAVPISNIVAKPRPTS